MMIIGECAFNAYMQVMLETDIYDGVFWNLKISRMEEGISVKFSTINVTLYV